MLAAASTPGDCRLHTFAGLRPRSLACQGHATLPASSPGSVFARQGPDSPLTEEVVVLDYGGQYSQLIARRVRECRVYSELVRHDAPVQALRARHPRALILSGGPASVYAEEAPGVDPELFELEMMVFHRAAWLSL